MDEGTAAVALTRPDTAAGGGSVGHVLDLIRRAGGLTRAEIIEKTGLSRSTVAARLEALQTAGWVSSDQATAARGRPPSHFHFRADQGALLIVDAGATGVRTAITDLHGRIEHELRSPLDITVGPQPWLTAVDALFDELLESACLSADSSEASGLRCPAPWTSRVRRWSARQS